MKRHIPLLVACTVFGALFSAQSALAASWISLTSPTSSMLNGIDCASGLACIAVGANGVIIGTTDKTTWTAQTSGTTVTLHDVDMVSASTAIAVGDDGVILKTTDGGATWMTVVSGTIEQLWDIHMASSSVGWAVGEDWKIMKTTDGGSTWTDVGSGAGADYRAVTATSTTNVWVAGKSGKVFHSTNGGSTWTDVSHATSETIHAIYATGTSTAIIGGTNGLLAKTTNTGSSWSSLSLPSNFTPTASVLDLAFWTNAYGNLIGSDGSAAATSNTGSTWTADSTVYSGTHAYTDAAVPTVGVRYIVGDSGFLALYDAYGPDEPTNLTIDGDATDDDYANTTTPTLTWTATTDDEGSAIDHYEYSVDGGAYTATSGTTSQTLGPLSAGAHTVDLRAVDAAGNDGDEATLDFVIDTVAPTVSGVAPTVATTGVSTTYSVVASDATSGVDTCAVYRNSTAVGLMTYNSSTNLWSVAVTTNTAGTYALYAVCHDVAGNSTTGATNSLIVTGATSSTADTTAPTVGSITPTTAIKDTARTLSVTASDSVGVASCSLYVNSSNVGGMTLSGTTASKSYTFASAGTYTVYATCVDASGNVGTGSATSVVVSATSTSTDTDTDTRDMEANPGDLMKMACDDGADVNDPCKAVYFFGVDAHRHAFPNEKVYFTWYENFDDVVIVSDDFMASVALGRNVTYHPGTRLVKFVTVNTVYAVDTDGKLRPIVSEDVAKSIWGTAWAKQVDDISDAFYGNYTFGTTIDSTRDFDPDAVEASVTSINDLL